MALKSLSVDKLLKLKSEVEAALASKVREQRRELELELSKLDRFQGGRSRGGPRGARGAVAPKYRNPENPTETWAGRGLQPRWLAAAIKFGKKLEDFAIAPTAGAGPGKAIKKTSGGQEARRWAKRRSVKMLFVRTYRLPTRARMQGVQGEQRVATFRLFLPSGFVVASKSMTSLIDLAQHPHSALRSK
jgi:DNA-binding protein H-NS